MITPEEKFEQGIRSFVRGQNTLGDLADLKISVKSIGGKFVIKCENPVVVTINVSDVATGLLRLENDYNSLRSWAQFILASSELIDFEEKFETDPRADLLLGEIWELAFGNRIRPEAVQLARELGVSSPGEGTA